MTDAIIYPSADGLWEIEDSSLGEGEIALEEAIASRVSGLIEWLQENAPCTMEELTSLDSETREQLFWHYGYLVALRAVRNFIRSRQHVLN